MKALISVSDKTGIVEFSKQLVAMGVSIISTGGTYKTLQENNVPVTGIEDVTGFPEMLDGRVKTLHPKIHGGILALRDNDAHMKTCEAHDIGLIDLVIVNLYPFSKVTSDPKVSVEDAIENIDIGGPSMVRSSAKNYRSVTIIVNPERYDSVIQNMKQNSGKTTLALRESLAKEAFQHTASYDATIAQFFEARISKTDEDHFPDDLLLKYNKKMDLRYGENPHQKAAFYTDKSGQGLGAITQLHGKELSYNNLVDLEAAWLIVAELEMPGAAIIKHTNPCGAAIGDDLLMAYQKAYESDPVSAFGSIIGLNRTVDLKTAEQIAQTFVEVVIAPDYDEDALNLLTKKQAIRLIKINPFQMTQSQLQKRFVVGGVLVQSPDNVYSNPDQYQLVTTVKPKKAQLNDLQLGDQIAKHVKSNAIVVVKDGQLIGVGAGQMSRVDAVEIALKKAGKKAKGAILASDAFFPFKDSVELAREAGIAAVIQPGGSKRDQESIDECNNGEIAMVFTGMRHFKH